MTDPRLRIVPNEHLPVLNGTERVVAELVEITTQRMAEAYVSGFKQGVTECLRIVNDSALLAVAPDLRDKLQEIIDQLDGDHDEMGQ